jgi:VIT1/CCC1 family predicted Fe2+/Mn2+ transporter
MSPRPESRHATNRIGWLRAAVLGANDGIVSTASLILGVAATQESKALILISGVAGLVAGAMSMAAGEYVSVQSQADVESADLERERQELKEDKEGELQELTAIYVERGLDVALARQVAEKLTAHDALGTHARDELGLSETTAAKPVQASAASALSFAVGAALPLSAVVFCPHSLLVPVLSGGSLVFLAGLGALSAYTGGAPMLRAALRVAFWGALAMGLTALAGKFVGRIA